MLVSNHPFCLLWRSRTVWLWSALLLLCYQNRIHAEANAEGSDVGVFGLNFRSCASLTQNEIYLLLLCKRFYSKGGAWQQQLLLHYFSWTSEISEHIKRCPPEFPSPTCILKYVTM